MAQVVINFNDYHSHQAKMVWFIYYAKTLMVFNKSRQNVRA